MATQQLQAHCTHCNQLRPHNKPTTNHVLHLLLSLVTMGLWVVVWLLVGLSNAFEKARCAVCGQMQGTKAAG